MVMQTLSRYKVLALPIFAVLMFFLSYSVHDAQATSFSAIQSGNWNDAATWGSSNPPLTINSTDTVTIPAGISVTIQNGDYIENYFGHINNTGELNINAGGTITNFVGIIINNSGGTITNNGDIGTKGTILNNGTIINNATIGNYLDGKVNNRGI